MARPPPLPVLFQGPEGDKCADAGDSDTKAHVGLHLDESAIYTGVHAHDDRNAGQTHPVTDPGEVDRNFHTGPLTVGPGETGW